MTPAEAIQRWDAFLTKIDATATELMTQAEQGCAMLLDLNNLDPMPMSNAWTAVNTQLLGLATKVDQTWREKVEPALEEAERYDDRDRERAKGDALNRKIETSKERLEIGIFGVAAQKILAKAKENLAKDFRCTQCFATLTIADNFFRSRHVPCQHCNTVNTFVPGTQVMAVEYFCCHYLARLETRVLYEAWLAAETKMRRSDDDLAAMKAAERALVTYTTAYLEARIAIVPEYEKDFDKDLKGKMACFYEEVSRSTAWRP